MNHAIRRTADLNVPSQRVGTVVVDPIRAVIDYALANGVNQDRVENLIGLSLENTIGNLIIPAIAGPTLFGALLDDGIGIAPAIEVAQDAPFSFFGGLERAVFLAPTGREALKQLSAAFAVFHDRLIPAFEETRSYYSFSFRYPNEERDNGACNEVVIAVLIRLMRSVFGRYGNPREVRLRYDRNGQKQAYSDFYASSICYRTPDKGFGLVFRKEDMEWHQPGYDEQVFELSTRRLLDQAARRSHQTPASDFLELINAADVCARSGVFKTLAIAQTAGLNERRAQRIAQQHESSLGKLLAQSRLKVFREQLSKNPNTSVEEFSNLLGFSDGRAVRRALKSWTGQSLSELRARTIS